MHKNQKKGQVTLFIVIGIIMLLALVVFVSIREEAAKQEIVPGVRVAVEDVPVEFSLIRPFVESCISDIAEEALIKLGEHGGYIDPAEFGINAVADPTAGSAVRFSAGSGLEIPYWFYLSSDNKCSGNCQFSYGRPALYRSEDRAKSIEAQLDKYVDNNLKDCLNDFEALKQAVGPKTIAITGLCPNSFSSAGAIKDSHFSAVNFQSEHNFSP